MSFVPKVEHNTQPRRVVSGHEVACGLKSLSKQGQNKKGFRYLKPFKTQSFGLISLQQQQPSQQLH
jgi:hypothetical protein